MGFAGFVGFVLRGFMITNEAEASQLLKIRQYLIQSIAQASDEIKKIDNILNEVKK